MKMNIKVHCLFNFFFHLYFVGRSLFLVSDIQIFGVGRTSPNSSTLRCRKHGFRKRKTFIYNNITLNRYIKLQLPNSELIIQSIYICELYDYTVLSIMLNTYMQLNYANYNNCTLNSQLKTFTITSYIINVSSNLQQPNIELIILIC